MLTLPENAKPLASGRLTFVALFTSEALHARDIGAGVGDLALLAKNPRVQALRTLDLVVDGSR